MNIKIVFICIVFSLCFYGKVFPQIEKYNYKNWPGKNTIAKKNVEIDNSFVSNYKLSIAKGYNDSSVFYKIPFSEDDSLEKGRLQVSIFSSSTEAQLALVEYLDCLAVPEMLKPLNYEHLKHGDIAFGKENDGIYQLVFTRNNVLVVLHAPTKKALLLANEIDLKIQNAPEWKEHNEKPSIIFAK